MKTWQKISQSASLRDSFRTRARLIQAIREFFADRDFDEVETPLLVRSPGTEPYLEVFETALTAQENQAQPAYLLTSPEYAMKKLLVAGYERIYQVCKSFRNAEPLSQRHNPEFTILEWYRAHADYTRIMADCEALLLFLCLKLKNSHILEYQGVTYDLSQPALRLTVAQAFWQFAQIDQAVLFSEKNLPAKVFEMGLTRDQHSTWEEAFHIVLLNKIEPYLGKTRLTILYEYPVSQAALARVKPENPLVAERFELYLAGLELGNAFSELTEWQEQESRLRAELRLRTELGKTDYQIDSDFIDALKSGMPESGGIAVGVDRLVMLFANVSSIAETLFFPATEIFE